MKNSNGACEEENPVMAHNNDKRIIDFFERRRAKEPIKWSKFRQGLMEQCRAPTKSLIKFCAGKKWQTKCNHNQGI